MCQSPRLLGSLLLEKPATRIQAPTSIGGSTSGRVAGMASAEVGGLACVARPAAVRPVAAVAAVAIAAGGGSGRR